MIRKLFCWLGFHRWRPWAQSHYEQVSGQKDVNCQYREMKTRYCRCCGKLEWRVAEPNK